MGLFCFDPAFLSRPDFSVDRFAFFLKTLRALREELKEAGGDLLVLDQGPQEAFQRIFSALGQVGIPRPGAFTFNRDYEPFARRRDDWALNFLMKESGIEVHTERDHLLIEPNEISKPSGGQPFYSVFTPFSRRWFELLASPEIQSRIQLQSDLISPFKLSWEKLFAGRSPFRDALEEYLAHVSAQTRVPIPEAGSEAAFDALQSFRPKLGSYASDRDFPALPGTSRLSLFLKNGSLTSAQVLAALKLAQKEGLASGGASTFLKEIAWREFYYHILWHRPEVEHEAFLSHTRHLKWENDEKKFEAWKEGRTGYPIVDAGMRELATTGWMHNRVRMIVASFLTKDLLIDWRWGERYFMERLLDGDLAANNGGWQWAASTGCDPQPYFRIFNPELQSRKFDPKGKYIRRFVPELKDLDSKEIHAPGTRGKYHAPIVDHREQREKALALFRKIKKGRT